MKNNKYLYIYYLIGIVLLLGVYSCSKDLGNYDYLSDEEVLPVQISGLPDTITIIYGTELELNPTISNISKDDKYSYTWYAYLYQVSVKIDTLGNDLNLKTLINFSEGPSVYNLYLQIKDVERNIYTSKHIYLRVIDSEINSGWYVLKDDEQNTDFDYINSKDEIFQDVLLTRSTRIPGKARGMIYQNFRYTHQYQDNDGKWNTLMDQKVFHITTSQSINTLMGYSFKTLKNFEEQFYQSPSAVNPQYLEFSTNALYMLNNDRMYTLNISSPNIGKYAEKIGDYELFPSLLCSRMGALVYDKTKEEFLGTSYYGIDLYKLLPPESTIGVEPIIKKEVNVKYLLQSRMEAVSFFGYALFQDKIKQDKHYLSYVSVLGNVSKFPFSPLREVPKTANLIKSKVITPAYSARCLYHGIDNILSVYLDSDVQEREYVLKKFPENEKIVSIKNINNTTELGGFKKFNRLAVLTNSPEGWKLYCFNILGFTPDINPEPVTVYSGKGIGRSIMFRGS